MVAKEPDDPHVEIAVKGSPIKVRRVVGANARNGGRKLLRARRQKCIVTCRNDVNLGLTWQNAGDARGARGVDTVPAKFRSPDLQGDLDACQAFLSESSRYSGIGKHRSFNSRIVWQVRQSGAEPSP